MAFPPVPPVPPAPRFPARPAGNPAQGNRYRENLLRQLFPGWKYPAQLHEQDGHYFVGYFNEIRALRDAAQNYVACGPAVLLASQRIYDDELARRESINTRCGTVLGTGGILGALFVAAAQLGLIQEKGKFGILAGFLLAAFIIALVYIGTSITMALAVQGQVKGNTVDPTNISTEKTNDAKMYDMELAIDLLNYTVNNYEVNNDFKYKLNSAQRCLRNGIIAITIAGILSPWTLRTAASSVSITSPSPVAYHRTAAPPLTVDRILADLQIG